MARPLRIDVEGGIYHVVTRGIDRADIFRSAGDREHLLKLMDLAHQRFCLPFLAYVLMDNHVHFIVQTPEANLSRAMQWLKVSYSMWFNKKYQRVGPLFQGRFGSVLVDPDDHWLLELSLYVHLNPVRVTALGLNKQQKISEGNGVVRPTATQVESRIEVLRKYRWSSFPFYAGYRGAVPEWIDRSEILSRLPKTKPLDAYRKLATQRISNEFDSDVLESLSKRLAMGSADFIKKSRTMVGDINRDTNCKKELKKRTSWEDVVQTVEHVRMEPWDTIRLRYGDIAKAVVFRLARQYCGMTLKEIGGRAGGLDYAAVSDLIRRYERRGITDPLEREMVKILNLET